MSLSVIKKRNEARTVNKMMTLKSSSFPEPRVQSTIFMKRICPFPQFLSGKCGIGENAFWREIKNLLRGTTFAVRCTCTYLLSSFLSLNTVYLEHTTCNYYFEVLIVVIKYIYAYFILITLVYGRREGIETNLYIVLICLIKIFLAEVRL